MEPYAQVDAFAAVPHRLETDASRNSDRTQSPPTAATRENFIHRAITVEVSNLATPPRHFAPSRLRAAPALNQAPQPVEQKPLLPATLEV